MSLLNVPANYGRSTQGTKASRLSRGENFPSRRHGASPPITPPLGSGASGKGYKVSGRGKRVESRHSRKEQEREQRRRDRRRRDEERNSEKRGSVTLTTTTIITMGDVVTEIGITMVGLIIMIGTTTTIATIQEVMAVEAQAHDKVMIIIMKAVTAQGVTDLLVIMVIAAKVTRVSMGQRNQVSAVIVGVAETATGTIGIIENRQEGKGLLGAMKRKNRTNPKGTCQKCEMILAKMVVKVNANLIKVNTMFHQYQVLRIFIPPGQVEARRIRLHL